MRFQRSTAFLIVVAILNVSLQVFAAGFPQGVSTTAADAALVLAQYDSDEDEEDEDEDEEESAGSIEEPAYAPTHRWTQRRESATRSDGGLRQGAARSTFDATMGNPRRAEPNRRTLRAHSTRHHRGYRKHHVKRVGHRAPSRRRFQKKKTITRVHTGALHTAKHTRRHRGGDARAHARRYRTHSYTKSRASTAPSRRTRRGRTHPTHGHVSIHSKRQQPKAAIASRGKTARLASARVHGSKHAMRRQVAGTERSKTRADRSLAGRRHLPSGHSGERHARKALKPKPQDARYRPNKRVFKHAPHRSSKDAKKSRRRVVGSHAGQQRLSHNAGQVRAKGATRPRTIDARSQSGSPHRAATRAAPQFSAVHAKSKAQYRKAPAGSLSQKVTKPSRKKTRNMHHRR